MPEAVSTNSSGLGQLAPSAVDATFGRAVTGDSTTVPENSLWLPMWAAEVIHAYDEYQIFESKVDTRTIVSGTSLEFPMTGTIELKEAWAAGEELSGGGSRTNKFTIKLDERPIAAHFELDNVDLMIEQFEYRSELARQTGQTLANARDRQLAALIAKGAATASRRPVAGTAIGLDATYDGNEYSDAAFDPIQKYAAVAPTTAQRAAAALKLLEVIDDHLVYAQEANIPEGGWYLCVDPRTFQDIRKLGVADSVADVGIKQPFFAGIAEQGGLGMNLAQHGGIKEMLTYMGVTICKSNHLPKDVYNVIGTAVAGRASDGEYDSNYAGDYEGIIGLLWKREGVASLKKQGLKVNTVEDVRRNTQFTVASMFNGGGVLSPELCATISAETVVSAP